MECRRVLFRSEFTIGELTDRSRAAVPVIAAAAGLVIPAMVFLAFNPTGANAQAWGVVISTDPALLVGALAILKPKLPARVRILDRKSVGEGQVVAERLNHDWDTCEQKTQ